MYKSIVFCLIVMAGLSANAQTAKDSSENPCEGCGKNDHPQSGKATIDVDGLKREYILKLPADYDPGKQYKLIFVPHPLGGTRDMIADADIGAASIEGNRSKRPLLSKKHNEVDAVISPDGRWMAYSSDESGKFEIYLCP